MKKYKSMIIQTITLMIICSVTALCLAAVNAITKDPIAEAQAREKDEAVIRIFPEAERRQTVDISGFTELSGEINEIYEVFSETERLGYVIEVDESSGFGGNITMMLGINSEGSVQALEIIAHSETVGFGANIEKDEFRVQFKGLQGNAVIGENIDALSGATISSKAVAAGVNAALRAFSLINGAQQTEQTQTEPLQDEQTAFPVTEPVTDEMTTVYETEDTQANETNETNTAESETQTEVTGEESR